jgi:hypothetical protein
MKIIKAHLTFNPNSRPGRHKEMEPRVFLIHWPGKRGQRAMGVRDYFELLKTPIRGPDGKPIQASAHGALDQDGTLVECIPYEPINVEMAYHAGDNYPNYSPAAIGLLGLFINARSLGFEWCFEDPSGKPERPTWDSAVELYASCCILYQRDPRTSIYTHNWATGKGTWGIPAAEGPCHKYFVEHPDELDRFRQEVREAVGGAA